MLRALDLAVGGDLAPTPNIVRDCAATDADTVRALFTRV
jgi:hypothetical protein